MPPPGQMPAYYRNWESPYSYAPPPMPLPFGLSPQDLSGMGAGGAALTTLAPMLSEYARSRFGMFGFTFGSGMNPATTEYGRDFMRQTAGARQAGAEADQAGLNDLLRGMAVIIGHKVDAAATRTAGDGRVRFDEAGERMIARMSSDSGKMLPFLAAMMPDAIDAAIPGGSRTVASSYMTAANRLLVDRTNGRSLAEDNQFVNRILDPLIAAGPGATDGLRAGRVGNLYAELASRGLISTRSDQVLTRETYDSISGVSRTDDAFANSLPTQAQVRGIQADDIRRQLGGYAKTVAAINEIFAEGGRSNAPMAELIQSLENMTQGGLSVYRADQLTQMARRVQGLTQETGLSREAIEGMAMSAGGQLAAFGAHRGLALPAATYAGAAGAAYTRSGYSVGPETGGQAEQIAMALSGQTSFAGSEVANVIGALDVQSRYLGPGGDTTDLGKVVANMRLGRMQTTLADGTVFDIRTANGAQLTGLAARSGLSAESMLGQLQFGTRQNRAAFVGNDVYSQVLGVEAQRTELERTFSAQFGANLDAALGGRSHREFFDAVYQATHADGVTTMDDAVVRAGERLGFDRNQAAILGSRLDSLYGEYASQRGLPDLGGIAVLRQMSPQFRGRVTETSGRVDERARRAAALAQLNPQGMTSSLSDAVVGAGRVQREGWFGTGGGYYSLERNDLDYGRMGAAGFGGGVSGGDAARALDRERRTWSGGGYFSDDVVSPPPRSIRPGTGAGPNGTVGRVTGELTIIENGVRRTATLNGEQMVPNVGGAR